MADRAEVERFLREAYAARQRADMDEILTLFHPAACFAVNGGAAASGRTQCAAALGGLLDAFQLLDHSIQSIVIDGDTAVVHWHGRFRAPATGQVGETDLLDLIKVKDGRIASFKTFFDTAFAARLAGR